MDLKHGHRALLIIVFCLLGKAYGAATADLAGIKNLQRPAERFLVGGQPGARHFRALRQLDVNHVINLRPRSETPDFNEAKYAAGAGLVYHALPITDKHDLTLANVRAFDTLLNSTGQDKVFLHCASGNRVGAMIALRAALVEGKDTASALALGKAWGLTRLEPEVRRLLSGI